MLTNKDIQLSKEKGLLIPFKPIQARMGTRRVFLLSRRLYDELSLNRESTDAEIIDRWARLEGDILHFITGGYINWNLMKWLEPKKYEHWTLRSVRPRPSIRVFGRFAQPNVFVGTHAIERKSLKGKWDFSWEVEKLVCEQDVWIKECGLPNTPFSAQTYEEYITENANREVKVQL